jgi:hypothetical protein
LIGHVAHPAKERQRLEVEALRLCVRTAAKGIVASMVQHMADRFARIDSLVGYTRLVEQGGRGRRVAFSRCHLCERPQSVASADGVVSLGRLAQGLL